MPSPFPGMDPFIEGQRWEDFHLELIADMRAALVPQVRPRYVVEVGERVYLLPIPERRREHYLTLRDRASGEVVTAIEVLSPGNKRRGSDGRREYLDKREAILLSAAHLVELDLLRAGERLPTIETLPPGDYYAFVCREQERPKAAVYPWLLGWRLPPIPIPLAGDDADVTLDLQAVFTTAYDRAGYDYSLDYRRPVEPRLSDADAALVREVLAKAQML